MWKYSLLAFIPFLFFGCSSDDSSSVNVLPKEIPPQIFTLQKTPYIPRIPLSGTVEADKNVPLSSKIQGRIDFLYVDIGDFVKKGDILAEFSALDNSSQIEYQNALTQLQKTENTGQSNIEKSKISLQSDVLTLAQTIKTQTQAYYQTYNLLLTEAKISETTIQNTIDWLDRTLIATYRFQYTGSSDFIPFRIGRNQSVQKQVIKNEIIKLYQELENNNVHSYVILPSIKFVPGTENTILNFSTNRLEYSKKLQSTLRKTENLIRGTNTSYDFTSSDLHDLEDETMRLTQSLDEMIRSLDSAVQSAKTAKENQKQEILSAENKVQISKSNLALTQSNNEIEISNAKNAVSLTQINQKELFLRAPFSGVIIEKNTEIGELVAPGTPLFRIADISSMKVNISIPDILAGEITTGLQAKVSPSSVYSKIFDGEITKVNPAVDEITRKLEAEITITDPKNFLKIGMFADVEVIVPEIQAFFVPRNFIKEGFDGPYVVLEDKSHQSVIKLFTQKENTQIYFKGISEQMIILN